MNDLQRWFTQNFDQKVALSAGIGAAGLGLVAYLLNKSNVQALKAAADIATAKK